MISKFLSSIKDATLKADLTAAVSDGDLSYNEMLKIVKDAEKGGISAEEFSDLKYVVSNMKDTFSTSSYVYDISNRFVNGDTANVNWHGGSSTATVLGNLSSGSSEAQTDKLVQKWFLGGDLPADSGFQYSAVNTSLYGAKGPTVNDINQGSLGDCYLLASLNCIITAEPSVINKMIVDNGNNTYGVRFFINGAEEWVTVNNALPTFNGNNVYNKSPNIWSGLIEKAYVQLSESGTIGRTANNSYSNIAYGWADPITQITGKSVSYYSATNYTTGNWDNMKNTFISALNNHQEVWLGSYVNATQNNKTTFVSGHAFSIVGYNSTTDKFVVRNPWGETANQYWVTQFEANMAELYTDKAYIGVANATVVNLPSIQAINQSVNKNQSVSLTSMFSVTNGNITDYKFYDPSGLGNILLNGATNYSTVSGYIQVKANEVYKLQYVGSSTSGSENITISAFDGVNWSNTANSVITDVGNRAAQVSSISLGGMLKNQSVSVASLFKVSDADGDIITQYQFTDPTGLGAIKLNGAANLSTTTNTVLVSASDLSKLTYVAGNTTGTENISISVFDGTSWSSISNSITNVGNRVATITAKNVSLIGGVQSLAISNFFTAIDADGDAITQYQFNDPNGVGTIKLNSAVNLSTTANTIRVSASDLSKLTYSSTVNGSENIGVSVYDGTAWSNVVNSTVSYQGNKTATIAQSLNPSLAKGQSVAISSFFKATDADGDAITQYKFVETASLGNIQLNGAVNMASATEKSQGIVIVSSSELSKVKYTASVGVGGAEQIAISANDGTAWGTSTAINFNNVGNIAPIVSTPGSVSLYNNEAVKLTAIFKATDTNGDAISQYLITDPNGLGFIGLNGATNLSTSSEILQGITRISGIDFAKLTYDNNSSVNGSERINVSAYDGTSWSQSASALINDFINSAPLSGGTRVSSTIYDVGTNKNYGLLAMSNL